MTNMEINMFKAAVTQLCDSLDALTDVLREVRDALESQPPRDETSRRAAREYILVPAPPLPPPPPLPGPTL